VALTATEVERKKGAGQKHGAKNQSRLSSGASDAQVLRPADTPMQLQSWKNLSSSLPFQCLDRSIFAA
jgi:hypothetical protein